MSRHYSSTGKDSTGRGSTGDYSTGHFSTGGLSTGYYSTGRWSTGDSSTGSRSTGNRSTGDYSTGDWSISNYSTGHFSTEDYSGFGVFDKPCTHEEWKSYYRPIWLYFRLTNWIKSGHMTDKEKKENPTHIVTGGYLRKYGYQEAWQRSYNNATRKEQLKITEWPTFDEEKFYLISGIRIYDEPKTDKKNN